MGGASTEASAPWPAAWKSFREPGQRPGSRYLPMILPMNRRRDRKTGDLPDVQKS